MFCPKCGTSNQAGANFCYKCGTSLSNFENLDQREEEELKGLDSEYAALWFSINSLYTTIWDSSVQILTFVNELNTYLNRLTAHSGTAIDLLHKGRPAFSKKLEEVMIPYVQEQIKRFYQLYENKRRFEPVYPTSPMQSAFNESFRRWQSVFNHTCLHCTHYLGDLYYKVDICPPCGRCPRPG